MALYFINLLTFFKISIYSQRKQMRICLYSLHLLFENRNESTKHNFGFFTKEMITFV